MAIKHVTEIHEFKTDKGSDISGVEYTWNYKTGDFAIIRFGDKTLGSVKRDLKGKFSSDYSDSKNHILPGKNLLENKLSETCESSLDFLLFGQLTNKNGKEFMTSYKWYIKFDLSIKLQDKYVTIDEFSRVINNIL